MTYDLHERLRDLERTAPLGALDLAAIELAARGHRRTLVARRAGGALALVVVALVAVTLGGWSPELRSAPPAGPSRAASPDVAVRCGGPAPAPADGSGMAVVVPVPEIEGPDAVAQWRMSLFVTLVNAGDEPLVVRERVAVTYLVDADGRVVQKRNHTVRPQPVQLPAHGWSSVGEASDLRACDGSPLPDGDYTLHAALTVEAAGSDEPLGLVGGGSPVVVRDGRVQHDPPTGSADLRLTLAADPVGGYEVTVGRGSVPDGLLVLRAQVVARDAAGAVLGASPGTPVVLPAGERTGTAVVMPTFAVGGREVDLSPRIARTDVVVEGFVVTGDGEQRSVAGAVDVREQSSP
ncbi:hypothetical protein [Cellulomonas fimi]|uniref:hypothetical protein n=1 Tax=Cellulomonas fimi TaxID=1708 RepID=UPI0002E5AA38|nr:hypothetical protein [Cellulomonas fimi]NNH09031.1 hypothetical protein [Cellulomonas fimi]VEH36714.1 Uncharacterised protein [Cellulomonas fimi]